MKIKIHACSFAIAGAVTICVIYTFLALALKYFPGQTLKIIGTIHMMPKLTYIKPFIKVTPQAMAMGIISHILATFIICWLIASIYNVLQKLTK
jgi:hypothetical protein